MKCKLHNVSLSQLNKNILFIAKSDHITYENGWTEKLYSRTEYKQVH